jgi:hypothetical protein
MSELSRLPPNQLVDPQVQQIVDFLDSVGLPSDNIIAAQSERSIIGDNLPRYIEGLSADKAYAFVSGEINIL